MNSGGSISFTARCDVTVTERDCDDTVIERHVRAAPPTIRVTEGGPAAVQSGAGAITS